MEGQSKWPIRSLDPSMGMMTMTPRHTQLTIEEWNGLVLNVFESENDEICAWFKRKISQNE